MAKNYIALFSFRMFTTSFDPNSRKFQMASSSEMAFTTAIPITHYSKIRILFFLHLTPIIHNFYAHTLHATENEFGHTVSLHSF